MLNYDDVNNLFEELISKINDITVIVGELQKKSEHHSSSINTITNYLTDMKNKFDILNDTTTRNETNIKKMLEKKVSNTYVNSILSKIEILKNIIISNLGKNDQFISPNLLVVESIENQVKTTGHISEDQFATLNEIYIKQKRIKN